MVVGNAKCGPDDFTKFALTFSQAKPHIIVAVNESYRWLTRFNAWATLHPEHMQGWINDARARGRRLDCAWFFPKLDPDDAKGFPSAADVPVWTTLPWDWGGGNSGSSGLFGVRVAFAYGCDRIILAGVPMDTQPHVGKAQPWTDRDRFVAAWRAAEPRLKGKVRSMSGWTREFLGEPDLQWWCH